MKRLILTNDSSAAGLLRVAGLADFLISLERRFLWGPLPSDADMEEFFGRRTKRQRRMHWLDFAPRRRLESIGAQNHGLIELCALYDATELWIDPRPNDQLLLVCLLQYLGLYQEVASGFFLCQSDTDIASHMPEEPAQWRPSAVRIGKDRVELASRAWRAFGAPTPQQWFALLKQDLGVLPNLKQAVVELLKELPWRASGLGATEMRMLEVISKGNVSPQDIFKSFLGDRPKWRSVFGYWEIGLLLDDLAHCPAPAVSGLNEGPFTMELHDDHERHGRYKQSRLSLTPLGSAIIARKDDFSRHNPVHRWWGGTELTNDRLWRWDAENKALIAP